MNCERLSANTQAETTSRKLLSANVCLWHETDVLCVPTNVKSGHAADITAKTDFDPNGLREHSRDLPIAL